MVDQKWLTTSAGVKMPRIIYGTAWKKERTADLVVKAIRAGFRGIDTAGQPKHYNEDLVGTALQRLKDHGIERESQIHAASLHPRCGSLSGRRGAASARRGTSIGSLVLSVLELPEGRGTLRPRRHVLAAVSTPPLAPRP